MLLNQFYYTNPLFSNCPSFFVSYLHLHFISYKKLPNFLSNVILLTYLLIYLLTYLLTPWCRVLLEKLTGLQLVKKTPRISRNPKVHYRTHKRRPPVSILGQPNSVHIHTSNLLEIRSNIIRPSTPRSPQWSPSLRFPHQDPIHPPLLTHMRHMPSPSHSSRFYVITIYVILVLLISSFWILAEGLYTHCCVYSEKLLMMDRGTVRNM